MQDLALPNLTAKENSILPEIQHLLLSTIQTEREYNVRPSLLQSIVVPEEKAENQAR